MLDYRAQQVEIPGMGIGRESDGGAPLVCDLYCGLGGWSEGFLANGYRCRGYDIEAHNYGTGGYPGELILRDVRSIHGSELKDAWCIVGSSPCQEFSYRAMPWKRAKALPPPYLGMELFQHQFRIQREASEAAGHHIPMVVENVRGAEKWVGPARWHFGSYYLWGDVPALMPPTLRTVMKAGVAHRSNGETNFHGSAARAKRYDCEDMGPGYICPAHAEDGRKVPGFRFDGSGKSFQTASVEGIKVASVEGRRTDPGKGARFTTRDCGREAEGRKNGKDWFGSGENCSLQRRASSKSNARKAASAQIAKIPFPLAEWIAKTFLADYAERTSEGECA